jgi:hypothetical protein
MQATSLASARSISKHLRFAALYLMHYRLFQQTLNNKIKTKVEQIAFAHTKKVLNGNISIVFYDMTTLYFEASDEDDLRKTGFSKDGKHQFPQSKPFKYWCS